MKLGNSKGPPNSVIEDYSKITSILGLPTSSSKEEKKKLISKLQMLQDPNISNIEKAIIIDEILRLKENLSDFQKKAIISILEPEMKGDSKNKVIEEYSKISSILGLTPDSSIEQKSILISKLEMLNDPNITTEEKAIIIDEILKFTENLSESKRKEIVSILEPENNVNSKNKVITDYSKIASILGFPPDSSKEERRKLISKLEMLQNPNISTAEKAIIIDEILKLKENLSDSKKKAILSLLEPEMKVDSKNKIIQEYSKIASILGLSPNSSNEQKRKLISKLEMLNNPNITTEEKALIIDEILNLTNNLSDSERKEIVSVLEPENIVNSKNKVITDYSKIAAILGIPPGSSNEEKQNLISKLEMLQNPNISMTDKAIIIGEILKLKGNINEAKRKEILNILKPVVKEGNIDRNKVIKDYSKISSILGFPPTTSQEVKRRLISKLEMLQDPNITMAEKAIIIDEILRLKENLSETKKKEILKVLNSGNSEEIQNKVIKAYSDIASILGLPPNASKEEKQKLVSKLEMLQNPNISTAEKAIIIDEILQLKDGLSTSEKKKILDILQPNVEEGKNGIVKEFSKIATLLGVSSNASDEVKRELFFKLEALKNPNIDNNEKALILDEILRLNGNNLSDEDKDKIIRSLGLDVLRDTEDSIVTEYSKIASILGIHPNATKEEKNELLLKLEELKDPNIGIKEKATIIDDILRIKGTISEDIREALLAELTDLLEEDERDRIVKEVKVVEKLNGEYETVDSIESVFNGLENFSAEEKRKLLDSIFKLQDILKKTKLDLDLSFSEKIKLEKEKKRLIDDINEFLKNTEDANGNQITIEKLLPYPLDDSSELDPDLLLNKDILYKVILEEEDNIKNEIQDLEETLNNKPLRESEKRIILQKIEELKKLLVSLSRRYNDLEQRFRQRFREPQKQLSPERIRLFMKLYKINDAIAFLKKKKKPQSVPLTKKKTVSKKPIRFTQRQLDRLLLRRRCKNILCKK